MKKKKNSKYKDENIHPDKASEIIGEKYAKIVASKSLELYTKVFLFSFSFLFLDSIFYFFFSQKKKKRLVIMH